MAFIMDIIFTLNTTIYRHQWLASVLFDFVKFFLFRIIFLELCLSV